MDKLEKKVEGAAKDKLKKENPPEKKIRMSEVVAVFVSDWHKYIRASVKRKERDDLYCVWAIDYGVPMVVHESNITPLQRSFTGMTLNSKSWKRIHIGGMENCLPAEKQFNMAKESSDKQKLMNWSPQAIELVQKILNQAIKLEFEHVVDLLPQRRSHYFGRLMMQRPSDGQMMNVVKSLLEMNMAVLAEQEFKTELTSIESLSQPYMFSVNNELLDVKMCVQPVKTVSNDTGYSNSDIFESESENESLIGEDIANDLPIEDNEFFDDSVSVMQPRYRSEKSVDDAPAPIPEHQEEDQAANRSNSNASQEKSKNNVSKRKSDNEVQNNNTGQKVNNEKQQPKNAKRQQDRKQKNKDQVNATNQNDNQSQKQQQPQRQQQQSKQPHHQHQNQQKPNQQQHQPQQQLHHRQSMPFNQSGGQQRTNGEQRPNHSNFQHSYNSKLFAHPASQNQYRHLGYRNAPDSKFNGCAEFEASLGKPPPMARFNNAPLPPPLLSRFPPPLFSPIPPVTPYPMNFAGMYGPPHSHQPGQSQSTRQSNVHNQYHDDSVKQAMNLMSMLNIKPQNNVNNTNLRAQNRLRNRNSGFQGRSADNGAKKNTNGSIEKRNTDGTKPVVKDSPPSTKVNSEKSEKSQSTSERVE